MSLMAILAAGSSGGGVVSDLYAPYYPIEATSKEGAGWCFSDPPAGGAIPHYDRALSWYFEDEDVIISWGNAWNTTDITGTDIVGWELRDYEGGVVRTGSQADVVSPLNLGHLPAGWYKLYFERATSVGEPWFTSGGETTFIVSRQGAGLRDTPLAKGEEGGGWVSSPNRALIGSGMVRIDVDLHDLDRSAWRASLDAAKTQATQALADLAQLNEPNSAPRYVFVQFPDGEATGGPTPTPEQQYQITTTVQEMCELGVYHFEGRNEPVTSGRSGTVTAQEYAAFAPLVHAAHPNAKVVGPCPVNINPAAGVGLEWFEDFLIAGGGSNVDVISVHTYNMNNNDAEMGRRVLQGFLDLLNAYGQGNKERWVTEYGHYGAVYGSCEVRWQAQVMMTTIHLLWQYGFHRNNFMYYYDFSVGYWDQPMWLWSNNRDRKHPMALPLLWRTMVEETWGMSMIGPLDFGVVENRYILGSRLQATDGRQVLWLQGSGYSGTVNLSVTGASSIQVVDHFGHLNSIPVNGGVATVTVSPEPCYVRVPSGVVIETLPRDYGTNVTPVGAVYATGRTGGNGPQRAMDGLLNNRYETLNDADRWWEATTGDSGPSWWRGEFSERTFDTVEIICPAPWQWSGALMDFDVRVLQGGVWTTVATVTTDPPINKVWTSDKAVSGCWVDSYWDRRRVFVVNLDTPVTASGLLIYARDMSFGGGATIDNYRTLRRLDSNGLGKRIGQSGPRKMYIQEISLYRTLD